MVSLTNSFFAHELSKKKHKYNAIFIHGFSSSHDRHSDIFKRLNDQLVNYYTFDLPGHGQKQVDEQQELKLNYFADLVVDLSSKNNLII